MIERSSHTAASGIRGELPILVVDGKRRQRKQLQGVALLGGAIPPSETSIRSGSGCWASRHLKLVDGKRR